MLKSRRVWIWCGAAAVAALVAWTGWIAWQVNRDLNDVVRHSEAIQDAVEVRDATQLEQALANLREASDSAAERTSGITWGALTLLPIVGDDATGIKVVSRIADELARDGIEPLVAASESFEDLLPRDGRIDIEAIRSIEEPTSKAQRAFADADLLLADIDASGFIARIEDRFEDLRKRVRRAATNLRTASTATRVLPSMLGGDRPQHYLLVFQNNAEIRATGGLAGAVSYVKSDAGSLQLKAQKAGSEFGETSEPVIPLSKAESTLYGDVLGTYFVNAGMTPDVPRAAALLRARWDQEYPARPVDGVIMVDAVAIAYMLEATGPIDVEGVRIDGDNAVDELLHRSYLRMPDPKDQDAFFAEVAEATFDRFIGGVDKPELLIKALARAARERRSMIHSFDAQTQSELAGSVIAGEVSKRGAYRDPNVLVTLNDTTGAKMSYFLRYDVDITPTSCVREVQTYSAKARLRSVAPQEAATLPNYVTGGGDYGIKPGNQVVTLRVYAPVGGELGALKVNGAKVDWETAVEGNRVVGTAYVQLSPAQLVNLTWTMASDKGQTGATSVTVTPTIETKDLSYTVASTC
ncbi:DUF4012 domain-containing protein [Nocardioides sp. zg-536]|uniref:DUF4012 domain-containing protein n=1 Tax=Nocardioides faecalis TaxID=2803858 RepID=A0A938Y6G5_9ACTN|nr:DUF4012 domain-containing protein [Nocardioides faecalis]MBM9458391.1 DUF4012 domain-containing protein [Nocardioides faecalis]QVI58410.1 DUF4012 domain-containing protein [Nocardioides faecalis]